MAAGMTIIKSPELAARLPSAIAGLFAIATTILLGRVLFCLWTGLTAAVLLLVSSKSWWVNFVMLARQGMLDVPLTGFTIWAFLHLYRGIQRPQHWLLMGLPLGLAMLTKSFLTLPIVLTIVIFVTVLVLQGQPFSRMHWRYAAGCVTLALTVSLPWHLVQVVQHGNDFFDGYVLIHFLKTQRPEAGNLGAKSFYLIAIGQALPLLSLAWRPGNCFCPLANPSISGQSSSPARGLDRGSASTLFANSNQTTLVCCSRSPSVSSRNRRTFSRGNSAALDCGDILSCHSRFLRRNMEHQGVEASGRFA